jgi:hypothetical protein
LDPFSQHSEGSASSSPYPEGEPYQGPLSSDDDDDISEMDEEDEADGEFGSKKKTKKKKKTINKKEEKSAKVKSGLLSGATSSRAGSSRRECDIRVIFV